MQRRIIALLSALGLMVGIGVAVAPEAEASTYYTRTVVNCQVLGWVGNGYGTVTWEQSTDAAGHTVVRPDNFVGWWNGQSSITVYSMDMLFKKGTSPAVTLWSRLNYNGDAYSPPNDPAQVPWVDKTTAMDPRVGLYVTYMVNGGAITCSGTNKAISNP